ncbi:hypothetical protein BU17DRAFT_40832 [Hysterangium stoloniferum]|nr:hypothetical protein BU17DRAFT_40832 [Hysterangium stoloniferum]
MNSHKMQELTLQRRAMYDNLVSTVDEQDDPITMYDNLVTWILQNYTDHSESGLLEVLEECLVKLKDDSRYTADFRLVKLWVLFANHVEIPSSVYKYMSKKGIGKNHGFFFEQYAEALEREGRFTEAETVLGLGIRTQAKPINRLRNFQEAYQTRRSEGGALRKAASIFTEHRCSNNLKALRADPLRKIAPPSTLLVPHAKNDVSITNFFNVPSTGLTHPNPYAHLSAPPLPGKRPEKLRVDLTLLLEADGTEYCLHEARARHLGLLGKKWPAPPPPQSELMSTSDGVPKESTVQVEFNDQGKKTTRNTRRQSVTITINTKQALEDVLDMYNSPMDENPNAENMSEPQGTQTPNHLRTPASTRLQDENAGATGTKPKGLTAFQPYVDQKRENNTPGLLKFQPVTSKTPTFNAFTPNLTRQALVAKEFVTPVPAFKVVRPPTNPTTPALSDLKPLAEVKDESQGIDVFGGGGEDVTTDEITEEFTNIPPPPPPPRRFVPFVDDSAQERPLSGVTDENAYPPPASKILKFQVHRDENAPRPAPISQLALQPQQCNERPPTQTEEGEEGSSEIYDQIENEVLVEDRRCGMSSRFAPFDLMTPITERTVEFTTSSRAFDTPGSDRSLMFDKELNALNAQDAAEKLAAELQKEAEKERHIGESRKSSDVFGVDLVNPRGDTGDTQASKPEHSMSRSVFLSNSGFRPPNPCNPTDPDIITKLLSTLPPNPTHRDLSYDTANRLANLQHFTDKRARKGSLAPKSGGRISDDPEGLRLDLDGDEFEVIDRLGEGGFGAVFLAKKLSAAMQEMDEGDEDEETDRYLVAIKVVRPTNLWESYVLQRIISAMPEGLRRSIIHPHCLYAYRDESFLTLELCQQGTLLEAVNRAGEYGISQPGGGMDELLVMFFTVELLRILECMHDQGFIHGDLKIDNCLIRLEDVPGGSSAWSSEYKPNGDNGWSSKGLKLIDFGRTIDTKLYPPGQKFIADWKTDTRDCIEMREGRPWTYQADYSGLASIVYCMLFGKYVETVSYSAEDGTRRLRPSQPMKRYWQADLWNRLFDTLLNPTLVRHDGSLPITDVLVTLCHELETWVQGNCNKAGRNLKSMLKKIEIASLNRLPRK